MSRGLSQRQNDILGLAAAVNRFNHGGIPVIHEPNARAWGGWPAVIGLVEPDVTLRLIAHLLYGVGLRRRPHRVVWLESTPAAMSARSSAARALDSLHRRQLLVDRPSHKMHGGPACAMGSGFVLAQRALDIGLQHEREIPDLPLRLALLAENYTRHPRYEGQPYPAIPPFLPSPAVMGSSVRPNASSDPMPPAGVAGAERHRRQPPPQPGQDSDLPGPPQG